MHFSLVRSGRPIVEWERRKAFGGPLSLAQGRLRSPTLPTIAPQSLQPALLSSTRSYRPVGITRRHRQRTDNLSRNAMKLADIHHIIIVVFRVPLVRTASPERVVGTVLTVSFLFDNNYLLLGKRFQAIYYATYLLQLSHHSALSVTTEHAVAGHGDAAPTGRSRLASRCGHRRIATFPYRFSILTSTLDERDAGSQPVSCRGEGTRR
ncbi:hypothetical protein EVAR_7976_1 [Eumeta japonica]|uniref:Uncharacterized protein n=1 Tax=Eumeta variegata TaxID=151549 RepID=A0A4C1TGX8_EUMVA|nr:hypothetical protein EVAR_7976_1 [Eumeta japonica]